MRRASHLLAALAVALAVPLAMSAGLPAAATPAHAHTTPIQHLVVMTQDQHSFDNYLAEHAGVDGLPAGVCVPLRTKSAAPCVAPYRMTASTPRTQLRATADAQAVSVDGGRMDGFVVAQTSRSSNGRLAMGHYTDEDLPGLAGLAAHGVLFDHWFGSVPGGSIPNRLFQITATATADRTEVPAAGWPQLPTIFDRLTAAGVSWRVYIENYEPALNVTNASSRALRGGQVARVPLLAMPRFIGDPAAMAHLADLSSYYTDLSSGQLPAVSFVVSTASSEHAPATPARGQRLVATVANALIASPAWSSSAFLLQYDTSGGWYDHVAPPNLQGAQLGLRVPAVLISPYSRPGTVDHATLDSAAVLKLIERNWTLAPLTDRDKAAGDLLTAFRFDTRPKRPALAAAGGQRPAVHQPVRSVLYIGYGLALGVGAAVVAWPLSGRVRRRFPRRASRHPMPEALP